MFKINNIDRYVNSLFKDMDTTSDEIKELKLEMKEHILASINELIAEGKSEEESIKIALNKFGDSYELKNDLLKANNIKKPKFKLILYISLFLATLTSIIILRSIFHFNVLLAPCLIFFIPFYIVYKYHEFDNYRRKKIRIDKLYETMKILFTFQLAYVFSYFIFPILTYPNLNYDGGNKIFIELIPLKSLIEDFNRLNYIGISFSLFLYSKIKLILRFAILGFFIPFVYKKFKASYKHIFIGLTITLIFYGLKFILYFIGLSATGAYFEIDYILLELLGISIGVFISKLLKPILLKKFS